MGVEAADYERHMANIGQAQANARLTADWLARLGPTEPVCFAGCGPGQMLDYLPPDILRGRRLVFTDIHPDFLAASEARLSALGLEGTMLQDDLEATTLTDAPPNAVLVLVLEHCAWRQAIQSLAQWRCQRILVVIQENPPDVATAVTPGIEVPRTMQVFRDSARPHLIPLADLRQAMAAAGFGLERVETAFVAHGKMMHACHFVAGGVAGVVHSFRPELAAVFDAQQREWLERYFHVEPKDERVLSNPYAEVIERGGQIYFWESGGEMVGSVLAMPHGEELELGKLAVTAKAQGRGWGRRLAEEVVALARRQGYPSVVLYSDSSLTAALRLYESMGFVRFTSAEATGYKRGDVRMRLRLATSKTPTSA